LLGFIVGAVSGVFQFWLLTVFTRSISKGEVSKKAILAAVTQFLVPMLVLLLCSWLLRRELLWAGIGIAASMITLALIKFAIVLFHHTTRSRPLSESGENQPADEPGSSSISPS